MIKILFMARESQKDGYEAIRRQIKAFPIGPGLYFMKGAKDNVLYIGKAKNLRSRVSSYFQPGGDLAVSRGPKITEMLSKVKKIDFLETRNEVDAVLTEARLIKDIRPPYNTDLVDDKTFPYLEITSGEDFPGVYLTRKPRAKGARLFGPFASAKDLRAVLVVLQKIFRFRTCNLDIRVDDPKRKFFRPCLLYSIKQCTGPCGDKIDKREYQNVIRDLIKFLKSKRSVVLRQLKKQMAEAAKTLDFEKAGVFRDRIRLIERLDRRGSPDENVQPEVFAAEPGEALEQLQQVLERPEPIRIIEGIDVAHISGSESVGAVVKFIDGRPFKSGYRRFKIKTVGGVDDYAMIAEVVKRRYKYAQRGEELWPDVVLVDGGRGQLNAAESVFKGMIAKDLRELGKKKKGKKEAAVRDTRIVALAKREEEVYMQCKVRPLQLAKTSSALKLLQYVRDEAHRFAQHYHHILRKKKLLDER